jgi:hypothetical protein
MSVGVGVSVVFPLVRGVVRVGASMLAWQSAERALRQTGFIRIAPATTQNAEDDWNKVALIRLHLF